MREPTAKQRRFVAYYLGVSAGNATDAARRAGYRLPHEQGRQLLRKTTIRTMIDAQMASVTLSADEVLSKLAEHATCDISDLIKIDKRNRIRFDFLAAKKAGKLRLVKKMKMGKYGWEVEMYDAQSALSLLAKYHGLFDRIKLDDEPDEELERRAGGQDPGGTGPPAQGGTEKLRG